MNIFHIKTKNEIHQNKYTLFLGNHLYNLYKNGSLVDPSNYSQDDYGTFKFKDGFSFSSKDCLIMSVEQSQLREYSAYIKSTYNTTTNIN